MDREFALRAKRNAIAATVELNDIVKLTNNWESEEMRRLRKAVGLAIGRIEADILGEIYKYYSDIDDLA